MGTYLARPLRQHWMLQSNLSQTHSLRVRVIRNDVTTGHDFFLKGKEQAENRAQRGQPPCIPGTRDARMGWRVVFETVYSVNTHTRECHRRRGL